LHDRHGSFPDRASEMPVAITPRCAPAGSVARALKENASVDAAAEFDVRRPMTKKPARRQGPSARGPRSLRARIQEERDAAIARLHKLRVLAELDERSPAGGNESALDEGDAAQVSEQRDVRFATHERLARRINQLTAALERLERDDYGRCTICGQDINPERLIAIPEASTCVACQERQERSGSPEAVA